MRRFYTTVSYLTDWVMTREASYYVFGYASEGTIVFATFLVADEHCTDDQTQTHRAQTYPV